MSERTLSIVKPDAVAANSIGGIFSIFEKGGLKVVATKMIHLTRAQAEGFYAVHKARPFFGFGADTFRLVFPAYKPVEYVAAAGYLSVADNVHDYPLQLAAGITIERLAHRESLLREVDLQRAQVARAVSEQAFQDQLDLKRP